MLLSAGILLLLVPIYGTQDFYLPPVFPKYPGSKASQPVGNVPTINIDRTKIDSFINTVRQCRNLPALNLAIVQLDANDRVIQQYTAGYGIKDPVSNTGSVDANTKFCIGSCTKQFTSALVGMLLAQNNSTAMWDTPLSQLVGPVQSSFYSLPVLNNQLFTLRDVLAHRTDIPRFDTGAMLLPTAPRSTLWKNIHFLTAIQPLSANWRSSFNYNNWMFTLGGHIAEIWAANGMTWEQLVQRHIFLPLGMTSSTFVHLVTDFSSFAMPGVFNSKTKTWTALDKRIFQILQVQAPAGAICSSSNDMAKYLAWVIQQNNTSSMLPPKAVVRQTQLPSNLVVGPPIYGPQFPTDATLLTYGMGWVQGVYRAYRTIEHGGGIFGYLSNLVTYPDLRLGIFMSSTNDFSARYTYPTYLVPGIFDILLNLPQNFFNPTTLCTVYPGALYPTPGPPTNTTGFNESCILPNIPMYTKMAGVYNHPLWGTLTVTPLVVMGGQVMMQFQVGKFGYGQLCWSNYNPNSSTLRVQIDSGSPLTVFGLNAPATSIAAKGVITFNMDKMGNYYSAVMPFIETRASSMANTFYRTGITACSNNPCMHGGTCTPMANYAFSCACMPGFTGPTCRNGPMRDCTDLYVYYNKRSSGIYWIHPINTQPIKVYCDMSSGSNGSIIIQRRVDGTLSFNQNWAMYKNGFGDLLGNYWMGLDTISSLANSAIQNYTIRADLWDCSGNHVYETYNNFWLSGSTDKYKFHVQPGTFAGTANDGFTFGYSYFTQQNMQFSTPDQDNDNDATESCAMTYSSGWWFNACYAANLNGVYYSNCRYSNPVRNGIEWIPWKYSDYSMKRVELKIYRAGTFY